MTLTVTTPGVTLRRSGICITADYRDGIRRVPASDVSTILLTEPCAVTSELLTLCMERGITVTMLDRAGTPMWSVDRFQGGAAPMIHRAQLSLAESADGVKLAKSLLRRKNENRCQLLKRLAGNRRNQSGAALKEAVGRIAELTAKLDQVRGTAVSAVRQELMGLEGSSGRIYFHALSGILPKGTGFQKRMRGPEADPFSQLLNYGYGILYHRLTSLCAQANLNPYIGLLHAEAYNRPVLVYDLIEPFRADVEEVVFKLFSRNRKGFDRYLTPCEGGRCLSAEGKKALIAAIEERMEGPDGNRGRGADMRELVFELSRRLKASVEDGDGKGADDVLLCDV